MNIRKLVTLYILFICSALFAQIDLPPDEEDVPIDGGISLLMISSIGFGLYKIKKK